MFFLEHTAALLILIGLFFFDYIFFSMMESKMVQNTDNSLSHTSMGMIESSGDKKKKRGRPVDTKSDFAFHCDHLAMWIAEKSWSICPECRVTYTRRELFPADLQSDRGARGKQTLRDCGICKSKKHVRGRNHNVVTPGIGLGIVDSCVSELTDAEILRLRPIDVHSGSKKYFRYGYRVMSQLTRLSWRRVSVITTINRITDRLMRERCVTAYSFLMQHDVDSQFGVYRSFVLRHEQLLQDWKNGSISQLPIITETENLVEAALFPHLYPSRESCDTYARQQHEKASAKESFWHKVMNINGLRFRNNWELLTLSWQRYLQNTITGAIRSSSSRLKNNKENVSVGSKCLEDKPFTEEYWKNRKAELIDCVRQHGHPSIFLTIAPNDGLLFSKGNETGFPLPRWLIDELSTNNMRMIREAPLAFTIHFCHVINEIVDRVLCGFGSSEQWKKLHWLRDIKSVNATRNVLACFTRLEFQKRGTPHCHVLIWLKRCFSSTHIPELCKADLDIDNEVERNCIEQIQKSGKRPDIPMNNDVTFRNVNGSLVLRHPSNCEFIRPYIYPLTNVLRSHMDIQLSAGTVEQELSEKENNSDSRRKTGRGLLMRYVTHYGVKIQSSETLSNEKVMTQYLNNSGNAEKQCLELQVRCAMRQFTMTEPEMVAVMSDVKLCKFSGISKMLWLPSYLQAVNCLTAKLHGYNGYLKRPSKFENMTILQFYRRHLTPTVESVALGIFKEYSEAALSKTVAVGIHMGTPLGDSFYWKLSLCNAKYRSVEDVVSPMDSDLPDNVKGVAACMHAIPHLLQRHQLIRILEDDGHTDSFICSAIGFVFGQIRIVDYVLSGTLTKKVKSDSSLLLSDAGRIVSYEEMDDSQKLVYNTFESLIYKEERSDRNTDMFLGEEDMPSYEYKVLSPQQGYSISGPPGYGKTMTLLAIVKMYLVDYGLPVMCAFPTAVTAVRFLQKLKQDELVNCILGNPEKRTMLKVDTVHNCFHIPIDFETKGLHHIWGLECYALITIDEISMIHCRLMKHILYWWNITAARPALLLSGDFAQLQPISKQSNNNKANVVVLCKDVSLYQRLIKPLYLARSHRTDNSEFIDILTKIRKRSLDSDSFRTLVRGRWRAYDQCNPSEQDLKNLFLIDGIRMILTYTNKAALWINKVVLYSEFFLPSSKLGEAYFDTVGDEAEKLPIFKGMRILTTGNLDKNRGIVNGMFASVEDFDEFHKYLVIRTDLDQLFTLSAVPADFPLLQHKKILSGKSPRIFACSPAYAVTIHKSQGATYNYKIAIYLDTFISRNDPALAYVAISRVTKLSDLYFFGNITANKINGH